MDSTLLHFKGLTATLIGLLMDSRSECPKRRNLRLSISFADERRPLVKSSQQLMFLLSAVGLNEAQEIIRSVHVHLTVVEVDELRLRSMSLNDLFGA